MPAWFNRSTGYNQSNNNFNGNPQSSPRNDGQASSARPFFNTNLVSRLFGPGVGANTAASPSSASMTQRQNYNQRPANFAQFTGAGQNANMVPQPGRGNITPNTAANQSRGNSIPLNAAANQGRNNISPNVAANQGRGNTPPNTAANQSRNVIPSNMAPPGGGGLPANAIPPQGNNAPSNAAQPPGGNRGENSFSKPLPDGVRYEPLDENTRKLINQFQKPGQDLPNPPPINLPVEPPRLQDGFSNPQPGQPGPLIAAVPAHNNEAQGKVAAESFSNELHRKMTSKIEELAQHERNASLFYGYLSRKANGEDYRRALEDIGAECKNRHALYNSIYRNYKGQDFVPKETKINNNVSFHTGVSWAIAEESRALKELSRIYEDIGDDRINRSVNSLIIKKISDINLLQLINANKRLYY